ncbi:MAG: class I SAM-dependent methyltransferase [Alphaproteobacteria bacterium]
MFKLALSLISLYISGTLAGNSDPYTLQTDKSAGERLDKQAQIVEKSAGDVIDRHIKPGQTVLDIGCANGYTTLNLAKKVGPEGMVYAVDKSPELLEMCRKRMQQNGIKNVTFIQHDITKPFPEEKFTKKVDFVFMRWILMHLKNPGQTLSFIKPLLNNGAVIMSHEPVNSRMKVDGTPEGVSTFIDGMLALGKKNNVDYDMGESTAGVFRQQEIEVVSIDKPEFTIPAENAKRMLTSITNELKPKLLEHMVLSEEDIDLILRDYRKLEGEYQIPFMTYVTGKFIKE